METFKLNNIMFYYCIIDKIFKSNVVKIICVLFQDILSFKTFIYKINLLICFELYIINSNLSLNEFLKIFPKIFILFN